MCCCQFVTTCSICLFFFFQAEDGIRDLYVTGVQTCALPICPAIEDALQGANATFTRRLPAGLDTPLGRGWEGGVELSGGEWQKVAIARSMMRTEPLLTVLDEPTASLDPQTEHALFEQVAQTNRQGVAAGQITLIISHRF